MDDILSRGATQAQLKADVPTSPKNMPRPYSWYQLPSESTMSFANGRSARFDTPRQPRQRESRFTTARTQYGQPGCPFWHGEVDENDPEYNKAVVESIIYRGGEGDQGFRTMIVPVPRGMDIKEVLNEKFTGKGMILSASLHGTSKMTGGFNNLRVIFVNAPNFSPEEVLDFSILPDEPAYMLSRTAPMNSYLFNEIALGYTRMVHIMGLPDEGKDEVLNTLYSSHAKQMYIADPLLYSEWDDEGTFIMEFATIKAASTFARANAQFATAAGLVIQCVWSPCTAEWEKAGVPQSHVASPKSNVAEQLEITLDYGDDDSKEEPALPSKGKAKFADDSLEDGEIREEAGPSEIQTPAKKLHTVNKPRSARYWNTKYDGRLRLYSRGSNTFPRTGDDDDFVILTASAGQDVKGKGKAKMVEILSPLAEFQLSTRPRPRPAPVAVEHNDLMNYNAPSPPRAGPVSGLPRSEAMIDLASPPTVLDQANYSAQRSDRGVAPLVVAKGSEIAGTRLFTPVLGTAGPPSPVRADSPPRLKFQGMMSHLAQSSGSGQKQKESQSAGPKLMGGLFRRKAPVSYADLEADKEEAVASKKSEVKAKTETKAKTEVKEVKKTGMRQQLKNFMHSSAESFKTGRSSSAADKIVYSGPRPVIPGIAFTPGVPTLGPSLEPSTVPAMGHYVSPTGRNWDDEDEEEVEVASPSAAKVERLKEKGKAKEVEKDEKKEE